MPDHQVGTTRDFVLAKGFTQAGMTAGLIGEDDSKRLFVELFADPDRSEVRPQEAYQAILSSIQPGWILRLLQVFWPDPEPRLKFQLHAKQWSMPTNDGLDILHQGLILATQEYPLPFVRRTILEFVLPGEEGLAWWDGLTGLCAGFGVRVCYLEQGGIEELTRWMFNPDLEYRHP